MTHLPTGTRVTIGRGGTTPEPARIMRWSRKLSGPREGAPGYHRVRFDADGAQLLVHESAFVEVSA